VALCTLAISGSNLKAQSALPTGWSTRDIGSPALAGTTNVSGSTWTLEGGGVDIWESPDQFRFAYQALSGDIDISVRVASLENVDLWAKAGLMIRETLAADSRHVDMMMTADGIATFQRRTTVGAGAVSTKVTGLAFPYWVRLVRKGNLFTGYRSADGVTWSAVDSLTLTLSSSVYVGLAVTSHNPSQLATGVFTNLSTTAPSGGTTPSALPAPWLNRDIGGPSTAGSATASAGTFTVAGAGADIYGNSDQFQFVYQPLQGDVEVIARVAAFTETNSQAKAGVMIRESLNANSRNAFMRVSAGTKRWAFQSRLETGGTTYNQSGPTGAVPGWVRLVREGNLFSAYRSTNGTSWSLLGTDTINMSSTVYVGLAVTSKNNSSTSTATFTNVTARTAASGGSNQPPTVSITGPAAGATFASPATFVVTATASDTDGTVSKVDLYQGGQMLKSDVTSPYSMSVTISTAGTYQLSAIATDSDGDSTTSAPVSVTITSASTNQPPSVSLTAPAGGSTFTAPASMTVSASASDSDGTVSRVDFYQGATQIGSDTSSPYSISWTNVAAGTYSLTAIARDDDGATRTSSAVSVTVNSATNQLPNVSLTSPTANASFAAGANITLQATASDSDGTISKVEFYRGTTLIGSDTTSPYSVVWSGATAGITSLTARAYDNKGATRTSTAVSITVNAPTTPTTLIFTASADHATNVTSYTVALYRSTDAVTASPVATRDLGKPTPVGGDITVDISTLVNPLPAGSYKAVVRATGPGGTTASTASSSFTK
jgi:regulation of enolase protein 1 (concanavalin A-like superfamily)